MDFILRNLLKLKANGSTAPKDYPFENFDAEILISVLRKNRLLVRYLQEQTSTEFNKIDKIDFILKEEQNRVKKGLELMGTITKKFEDQGSPIMVIKSLDNYPDLGHDIDLYTEAPIKIVDKILIDDLGAKLGQPTISDRLARKRNYAIAGYPILEVHCGRLGQVGEQMVLARELLSNCQKVRIDGVFAYVPRPEHRLLITVLQRMYRHFNIRLCDVYNTIQLLKDTPIDWQYLKEIAVSAGLWEGLLFYLNYINGIYSRYCPDKDLNQYIKMLKKGPTYIVAQRMHFRFPLLSTGCKLYFKKFISDTRKLNFTGLRSSLIIVPLSLLHYISMKLFKRSIMW